MTPDQETLVTNNLRLAGFVARRYLNSRNEYDDLVQNAYIGLINAARTFNPDKGFAFSTYATMCIRNEICLYLRNEKKRPSIISLDKPINVEGDEDGATLGDILFDSSPTPDEISAAADELRRLAKAIKGLPKVERTAVILSYGLGGNEKASQQAIAERLGGSQPNVSRILIRAKKRIKIAMAQ